MVWKLLEWCNNLTMLPTTLGAPSSKSKSSPAVLPALHVNSAKWPSSFSLLFSLLLLLLLVLSFHVRDVVQKANKEARLTEYGQELGRVSDRLQALYGEADNLAEVYLSAKGEQQIGGKKKGLKRRKKGPPGSFGRQL